MNHRLREERERVARRWAIVANASVAVLFCATTAYVAVWQALRSCGHDSFGWGDEYRWCTLAETWTWLHSEASTDYWIFLAVMSGLAALGLLVATFSRDRP